jgi:hypothetical protein
MHVIDELVISDGATVQLAMRRAHDVGWGSYPAVHLHLDKSSKNRSTTGPAQWSVIRDAASGYGWNIIGNASGVNPPINARIDNLSSWLMDGNGSVKLRIDPRCDKLLGDLAFTSRGSNGYNPGRNGDMGHILDALGYLLWDMRKKPAQAVAWFGQ